MAKLINYFSTDHCNACSEKGGKGSRTKYLNKVYWRFVSYSCWEKKRNIKECKKKDLQGCSKKYRSL